MADGTPFRAAKRSAASIPVTWPSDQRLRALMTAYHAELSDCAPVNEAFLGMLEQPDGIVDDPLALVETARRGLALLDGNHDAVERALTIVDWALTSVLPTAYPELAVGPLSDIDDAEEVRRVCGHQAREAQDAWQATVRGSAAYERAYARYGILKAMGHAAGALLTCERRMTLTKHEDKKISRDRPLSHARRAAEDSAEVLLLASELSPEAQWTLERLGAPAQELAQEGVRARGALRAAGVAGFGPKLNEFAVAVLRASEYADSSKAALGAAHRAVPADAHEALSIVAESPELSALALPGGAGSLRDAAHELLWQLADKLVSELR